MNSGKCISAGFLIAGVYGLFRFLIFEAAFKLHIEENVAAHIAFTIAVVGFVVLGVKLIPEKHTGPLYSIPSIALLAFLFIGMSCCYDSCTEKGDKDDSISENDELTLRQKIDIAKDRIEDNLAEKQAYRELGLSQEEVCSNSKNRGNWVPILPPGQIPPKSTWGKEIATQDLKKLIIQDRK